MTRFSERTAFDLRPNPLARAVTAARAAGRPLIDLTASNPTDVGFALSQRALRELVDPAAVRYEPVPFGLLAAREAVQRYLAARGVLVAAERILLTASTSEAYSFLFKLLCDPGDEVLVPAPGYPLLDHLAALELVRLRPYRLVYDGRWHVDHASVAAALSPRSRAVVLVHPNNPTGSFVSREDLARMEALAAERDLSVVSDEVFADYGFEGAGDGAAARAGSAAGLERALGFALGGLSKAAGLPQMKLAWVALGGPEPQVLAARARLEVIADAFLSLATPVQHALPRLLVRGERVQRAILRRVLRNRRRLGRLLGGSPASLLAAEGGWYAVLRVPATRSDEAWALELVERDGVLVAPGFLFDFDAEGYLVVSLLPPPTDFDRGAGRLVARLAAD